MALEPTQLLCARRIALASLILSAWAVACGDAAESLPSVSGGGARATSGGIGPGGKSTAGAAQGKGGNAAFGGTQPSGGSAATGGTKASGGSTRGGATPGGSPATGGRASTGGAQTAGGSSVGGSTAATGGLAGGGQAVGGTPGGAAAGRSGGTATGGATGGAKATGGGATGGAATSGGMGTAGQATGGAATGGTSMGGASSDRCDVGVYNASSPPQALTLSGSLGTHDPMVIESNAVFYEFQTGLDAKTSANLTAWTDEDPPFSSNPAWIAGQVSGVTNLWAPDVSYFGGQYHLYYSASTLGSNRSCIGHATRAALDSGSWTDQGLVICSNTGSTSDDWNAIDPNLVIDEAGTPWLDFGSWWSGIKLIQLDQTGARVGTTLTSLASNPTRGPEGPFIVRRCGYYYLFTSWDVCCQGVNSTYNIRVGRSTSISGPYVDQAGTGLLQGGGTLVLGTSGRWIGPGGQSVLISGTRAYLVYHAYDGNNNGAATLRISDLVWDANGWPMAGGP